MAKNALGERNVSDVGGNTTLTSWLRGSSKECAWRKDNSLGAAIPAFLMGEQKHSVVSMLTVALVQQLQLIIRDEHMLMSCIRTHA